MNCCKRPRWTSSPYRKEDRSKMTERSHGDEISSRGPLNRSANRTIARSEFRMVKGRWARSRPVARNAPRPNEPNGSSLACLRNPSVVESRVQPNEANAAGGWFRKCPPPTVALQPNEPNETLRNSSQITMKQRLSTDRTSLAPGTKRPRTRGNPTGSRRAESEILILRRSSESRDLIPSEGTPSRDGVPDARSSFTVRFVHATSKRVSGFQDERIRAAEFRRWQVEPIGLMIRGTFQGTPKPNRAPRTRVGVRIFGCKSDRSGKAIRERNVL